MWRSVDLSPFRKTNLFLMHFSYHSNLPNPTHTLCAAVHKKKRSTINCLQISFRDFKIDLFTATVFNLVSYSENSLPRKRKTGPSFFSFFFSPFLVIDFHQRDHKSKTSVDMQMGRRRRESNKRSNDNIYKQVYKPPQTLKISEVYHFIFIPWGS